MNTFTLHLFAADHGEVIEDLASFTGEDKSGSFGLLAHHDRFMTVLDLRTRAPALRRRSP